MRSEPHKNVMSTDCSLQWLHEEGDMSNRLSIRGGEV